VCEEFLKIDFVRLFLSYPIFSDFVMKITVTIKERFCRLLKRINVFHTSFMKFDKIFVGNLKCVVCGMRHLLYYFVYLFTDTCTSRFVSAVGLL
jgi:hypothetical protein